MDWLTIQHSVTKLGIGAVVVLLNYKLVKQQSFNLITVIITFARKSRWKGMVIILCLCLQNVWKITLENECTHSAEALIWAKQESVLTTYDKKIIADNI